MKEGENALAETVTDPKQTRQELEERSRELECLHAALDPARTETASLEELLQYTVDLIPLAFRDPEVTGARASVTQRSFVTKNFHETPWVLAQDILVRGQRVGAVEVHFPEEALLAATARLSKGKGHFLEIFAARFAEIVRRLAEREEHREDQASLREKIEFIHRQEEALRTLGTPIIQVWDKVLLVPFIGTIDSARVSAIKEQMLKVVSARRARFVVADFSGIDVIDTEVAGHLVTLHRTVDLLGVSYIVTGIRPGVAQTMASLGVDFGNVKTLRSVQDGLRECLRQMGPARVVRMIWDSISRP